MNLRITNGFNKLSDGNLEVRAQTIIASMTDNANFPTPTPALATVQTALDDYMAAVVAAEDRGRLDVATKAQKRAALIELLHQLGNYVLFTSNNNSVVAISSGFTIAKQPEPTPALTKPENLQIQDGINAGEILVRFKKVAHARTYIIEYTPDPLTPESIWSNQTSTVIKQVIKDLTSGRRYWWRVAAVGTNDQVTYSDSISRVVQ